jgi:hypothetical protein
MHRVGGGKHRVFILDWRVCDVVEVAARSFRPCSSQGAWGDGSLILAGTDYGFDDDAVHSSSKRLGVVERRNCGAWSKPMRPALRVITEFPIRLIADSG